MFLFIYCSCHYICLLLRSYPFYNLKSSEMLLDFCQNIRPFQTKISFTFTSYYERNKKPLTSLRFSYWKHWNWILIYSRILSIHINQFITKIVIQTNICSRLHLITTDRQTSRVITLLQIILEHIPILAEALTYAFYLFQPKHCRLLIIYAYIWYHV